MRPERARPADVTDARWAGLERAPRPPLRAGSISWGGPLAMMHPLLEGPQPQEGLGGLQGFHRRGTDRPAAEGAWERSCPVARHHVPHLLFRKLWKSGGKGDPGGTAAVSSEEVTLPGVRAAGGRRTPSATGRGGVCGQGTAHKDGYRLRPQRPSSSSEPLRPVCLLPAGGVQTPSPLAAPQLRRKCCRPPRALHDTHLPLTSCSQVEVKVKNTPLSAARASSLATTGTHCPDQVRGSSSAE